MDKEHNKYIAAMMLLGAASAPSLVMSKEPGQLVEQLCSSCHSLNNIERSAGYSKVSMGVVEVCADETPEQAAKRADLNLYEAKRSGRNTIVA